jgi:transposase
MQIVERSRGDRRKLARMISIEGDAQQRDRLRAVALALDGRETLAIVEQVGRSRAFVQRWAYAYRDGGIDAIRAKTAPGRRPFLTPSQERALIDRLVAATKPGANAAALRGKDIQEFIEKISGTSYSLSGVYYLLHRLGFSHLEPRPRHPKSDPAAARRFRRSAPLFSSK